MRKFKIRSRTRIVAAMAKVMRRDFSDGVTASMFAYESLFIAKIRARFCLIGWPWSLADRAARDLVEQALHLTGAERPSWDEGQREWTLSPGLLIERTRCVRCHGKLPEGHFKFCSELCGNAHRLRLLRLREMNEVRLIRWT